MKLHLICPRCESQDVGKHGFYEIQTGWRRRWICKKCDKTFSESTMDEEQLLEQENDQTSKQPLPLSRSDKRKIKQRVRSHLVPFFEERTNTKYSNEEMIDLLLHIALNNQFLSSGTEQYQEQHQDRQTPSKNTIYERLKQLDPEEVVKVLDEIGQQLCKQLKQRGLLEGAMDVAIDEHDWRFYGEDDTEGVCRTKPDRGTSKAYKFVTVCIVSGGVRLTLGVVPVEETRVVPMLKAVKKLVKKAQKRVNIRFLYADRGFYMAPILNYLKGQVKYFVRAKVSKKMKNKHKSCSANVYVGAYTVKRKRGQPYVQVETRLVVSWSEQNEEYIAFVTNLDPTETMGGKLIERYRSRWGIETSYRMIRQFLAKTTSRKYQIRIGLFVVAVVLYNLWLYENARREKIEWMTVPQFSGLLQNRQRRDPIGFLGMVVLLWNRQKQRSEG